MSKYSIINKYEIEKDTILPDGFSGKSVEAEGYHFIYGDYCFSNKDENEINKIANCIFMFLIESPTDDLYYWKFVFDKNTASVFLENHVINTYGLLLNYPSTTNNKIDRILLNLHKWIKVFGDRIDVDFITHNPRAFLPEGKDIYRSANVIYDSICKMGLFDEENSTFSIEGWKRIDSLLKNGKDNSKTIFIASKFDGQDDLIKSIEKAIGDEGFVPITLYRYQTNDYIIPEMFRLIDKSIAVVADITSENPNVMFEIGYAKGKGIETILISQSEFNKNGEPLHPIHSFDVSQISIVYYKDYNDLVSRLQFRISNTLK